MALLGTDPFGRDPFGRRSGKIMRRLLKQIAAGGDIKGDTTTLEDLSVLAKLATAEE